MMGHNHVSSGLLAGLVTAPLITPDDWATQAAWVLAFGGTALLPDLDTPHATASRLWGPVTGALSIVVQRLTGGHRQGTHDLVLAPLAFALVAALAGMHRLPSLLVLALVIGLSLRGLQLGGGGRVSGLANALVSTATAWWLTGHSSGIQHLLPLVVGAGVAVHILGDLLTDSGVPIPVVWTLGNDRRLRLGLFSTGRSAERWVITPVLALLGGWLLWQRLDVGDHTTIADWWNAARQAPSA